MDAEEAQLIDSIVLSLEGVTVLEKPRVSRETIISVLREHTGLLRGIKDTIGNLATTMNQVLTETAENRESLRALNETSVKHQNDINELYNLTGDLRGDMTIIEEKLVDLSKLKDELSEQKEFVLTLNKGFNSHKKEIIEFVVFAKDKLSNCDKRLAENKFQMTELKDYVEHISDTLILPSSQIRVESAAGFSARPITLLETLIQCSNNFEELTNSSISHAQLIESHKREIDEKAPDSLIMNVAVLEKKVGNIEYILQKEEEQGVGAIRRQCDQLTADVQNITSELAEKVTKDSVNLIVHDKYEEIVKYLQDALQSSAEDEQNFKMKADELLDMVSKLNNTKVDRIEIAPMQEVLVKTEAMLRKANSLNKTDKVKDTLSRKEIEALFELKVDKKEYEMQWQMYMKGQKRNKLNAIMTGLPKVVDMATLTADDVGGPMSGQIDASQRDKAIWKGLADAMRSENDNAVIKGGGGTQHVRSQSGQGNNGDSSALMMDSDDGSEFASYIQSKRSQSGKQSTSMAFPSNHQPGAFRMASEGGRPGGLVPPPASTITGDSLTQQSGLPSQSNGNNNTHSSNYLDSFNASTNSTYPVVVPPSSSSETDGLAYLGGPIVGSGFNMRGNHMKTVLHQGGTSTSSKQLLPSAADLTNETDGQGFVVKGIDGHLYYTDPENNNVVSTTQITIPTAKQIVPQQRRGLPSSPHKKVQ